MQINNYKRNGFWRTEDPSVTIEVLESKFEELELVAETRIESVHDNLWSVMLEIPSIRTATNGKGVSKELAIASAYAEMAERISAGMENGIHLAKYRRVYGEKLSTLETVELFKYFPGYQWGHQDSLPNPMRVESFIRDHKFTKGQIDHLKMNSELLRHWIPGYSLIQEKEVQVPILFVKWICSSNGLASSNTIEEAIIHGACEVFERDALIKYLRLMTEEPVSNINVNSIEDPRIRAIINYLEENGTEVFIKDIGQSLYPVYTVLTFNNRIPKSELGYNFIKAGSSFSSVEAILRCLTERMQGTTLELEATLGPRPPDNLDRYIPLFFKGICPINLDSYRSGRQKEFEEKALADTTTEIDECMSIAKRLNTDLVVVDHTHPVIGFPTARVIMPGISDFTKWWDPRKITLDFLGNLMPEEDIYEATVTRLLKTFSLHNSNAANARNKRRRDV